MKSSLLSRALRLTLALLLTLAVFGFRAEAQRDYRVAVVDRASSPIMYLYASPVDDGSWEEDVLGSDVIDIDHFMIFNMDDGSGRCHYDFKAVLANGRTAFAHNINVCVVETWTVTD